MNDDLEITQADNGMTVQLTEWLINHGFFDEDGDAAHQALIGRFGEIADWAFVCHRQQSAESLQAEGAALKEQLARSELSRTLYARVLEKMRIALVNVHDGIEDEGDRIYFGSTNHADDLRAAWQLADGLRWDEIMEDTQPKTGLAEVNLHLQAEIAALKLALADTVSTNTENCRQRDAFQHEIAALKERLREAGEVVKPFAREADAWWDKIVDDARPWIAEPGGVGGDDAKFTIGDLRRARAFLQEKDDA